MKKPKPKTKPKPKKDWHYCHPCQIARGGRPRGNGLGITMTGGKCSCCGMEGILVPSDDYIWPGRRFMGWD